MLPNRRSLPTPHGISKRTMCRPTRLQFFGRRLIRLGEMRRRRRPVAADSGYWRQHVHKESARNTGSPRAWSGDDQPEDAPARDRPGAHGVAERLVVPMKPGNAGRGKGPQFKTDARRSEGPGDWATYQLREAFRNCRRRCTRKRWAEPRYRFYAPSTTRSAARTFWRTPMPSAAPTRARRAWTVRTSRRSRRTGSSDGWTNWRLRSRQETYRPDPIRRVYEIPEGQRQTPGRWASQPCGIGSACATAAMLVLEPIFEADLPSELYAYRPGRNAQQAVVEVEELLFRGHPEVVDADLADYLDAASYCPLVHEVRSKSSDWPELSL